MRRRTLVLCCALLSCVVWAEPAQAALEIVAPATGLTGQKYEITVRGSGPFDARVRFHRQPGTTCQPDYGDWERASGPFIHTFEFAESTPGPWALCARLVTAEDRDDAPGFEQAVAVIELSAARRSLSLAPARPTYALGEPVELLVQGHVDVETSVRAWVRALDGPPCSDAPWIGDQKYGEVRGSAGTRIVLDAITVPGTYRICARLQDAGGYDPNAVLETQVIVSQACTDARRTWHQRTAAYRAARGAYRRARGARRGRARRVMTRRRAAMDRARERVGVSC